MPDRLTEVGTKSSAASQEMAGSPADSQCSGDARSNSLDIASAMNRGEHIIDGAEHANGQTQGEAPSPFSQVDHHAVVGGRLSLCGVKAFGSVQNKELSSSPVVAAEYQDTPAWHAPYGGTGKGSIQADGFATYESVHNPNDNGANTP